jgi:hypothetical protein
MNLKSAIAFAAACSAVGAGSAQAAKEKASDRPLLVIGASYSEGKTPFNKEVAPLGGVSVGFGAYLSLGHALIRNDSLPGHLINEGQAGATTFARPYCPPGSATCGPAAWDSYQTQLERALARVALPPAFTTYTAKYVVVSTPNDCLHADAFGVPQATAQPCTPAQLNAVVDRLIAVGQYALSKGIVPIYEIMPRYQDLNLPLFGSTFGLAWVITEADYRTLRDLGRTRISSEVSGALVLDIWKNFRHIGDGVHPDEATVQKAARAVAQELKRRDK